MADRFEVHDRERVIGFTGSLLGEGTSWEHGKDRWTEVRIYQTEAGSFVVEVIGRSALAGEVDRCRAQVCETAQGAVESLYQYDDNEVRYMTRTARAAAELACVNEEFAQAYRVEEVA